MDKINVEDILAKHSSNFKLAKDSGRTDFATITGRSAKAAIKEIVEAVIDKYAEEAEKTSPRIYANGQSYPVVDGRTADNIKKEIEYE